MGSPGTLRVIAVDDEPLALRRISLAIAAMPDVALIATSRSGRDGLGLVREMKPDVLLLDINMAEFGGFDVIDSLGDEAPLIIFVTAFEEFAVKAFSARAQDYLLKPVEFDRLRNALEGARARLAERNSADRADELSAVVQALRERREIPSGPRFESELWAPWCGNYERLSVEEIDWIESEGDYVRIHARGKTYLLRETMAKMETRLDAGVFRRVHRSAIVNEPKVQRIERPISGRYVLTLESGAKVPVGRNYLKSVRSWLVSAAALPAPE